MAIKQRGVGSYDSRKVVIDPVTDSQDMLAKVRRRLSCEIVQLMSCGIIDGLGYMSFAVWLKFVPFDLSVDADLGTFPKAAAYVLRIRLRSPCPCRFKLL
jgi:hypothetical protein